MYVCKYACVKEKKRENATLLSFDLAFNLFDGRIILLWLLHLLLDIRIITRRILLLDNRLLDVYNLWLLLPLLLLAHGCLLCGYLCLLLPHNRLLLVYLGLLLVDSPLVG